MLDKSAETEAKPRPRFAREPVAAQFKLPEGKKIGSVLAVALAPNGDIYVLHQPDAQGLNPGVEKLPCWLPPLVHLTPQGEFVNAWGGHDHVPEVDGVCQWPRKLEGLDCDAEGNLWIVGFGVGDNVVLKFSPSGELLLRIGQCGKAGDDDDTRYLNRPSACYHDLETGEVFVADGYGNHRVIAFNADSGEFTRMWGIYGEKPSTRPPEEGFQTVHKVLRGPGGRYYVADRTGCKVQEFELIPGGARFTREVAIAPGTWVLTTGSVWDIGFSPDETYMYVADGANYRIWIVELESFEILGSTTVHTEYENNQNLPIHYELVHRFAVQPDGDLLLACVNRGVMRLEFLGIR